MESGIKNKRNTLEAPPPPGRGVWGGACAPCARGERASERTDRRAGGRALAADMRCGDSATRSDAPAVPRCGSLSASARAS